MDDNYGNDQNVGAADDGSNDFSDQGDQGGTPSSSSGTPDGQGGQQSDQGLTPREKQLLQQNRALNRALVEARRGGGRNNRGNQNQGNDDYDAFSDPAGQYGLSLQVATGQIRGKMEDVFSEYPELPNEIFARIRRNPWAYTTQDAYMNADVDAGLEDIALYLLEEVEKLNSNSSNGTQTNNQQGNSTPSPARVNTNPAPEPQGAEATPGSEEDEDLWTMPLNKLEKLKNKALATAQKGT